MTVGMLSLHNSLQFAGRGRKAKTAGKLGDLQPDGSRASRQPLQDDPEIRQLKAALRAMVPMHQAERCMAAGQRFSQRGRDDLALQAYDLGLRALPASECELKAYKAEVRVGLLKAKMDILQARGQTETVARLGAEVEELQPRQRTTIFP